MNQYPIVKFDFSDLPESYHTQYPFKKDDLLILLGEIKQMPGHCIVVDMKTGKIHSGFHTDNFIELTDDEL